MKFGALIAAALAIVVSAHDPHIRDQPDFLPRPPQDLTYDPNHPPSPMDMMFPPMTREQMLEHSKTESYAEFEKNSLLVQASNFLMPQVQEEDK